MLLGILQYHNVILMVNIQEIDRKGNDIIFIRLFFWQRDMYNLTE